MLSFLLKKETIRMSRLCNLSIILLYSDSDTCVITLLMLFLSPYASIKRNVKTYAIMQNKFNSQHMQCLVHQVSEVTIHIFVYSICLVYSTQMQNIVWNPCLCLVSDQCRYANTWFETNIFETWFNRKGKAVELWIWLWFNLLPYTGKKELRIGLYWIYTFRCVWSAKKQRIGLTSYGIGQKR
jgi:hypothetical protein